MRKLLIVGLFMNAPCMFALWYEFSAVAEVGGGADHDATPCGQDHTKYSLDTNDDGAVDLSDFVYGLSWFFNGTEAPRVCLICCPNDNAESNDDEQEAVSLGTITDCDVTGGQVQGALPAGDEDWFTYMGTDEAFCTVGATVAVAADGPVTVCQFVAGCDGLSFTCPPGTTDAISPDGRAGCCGPGDFELGVSCTGLSDDVEVYIRIDAPNESCVNYALDYNY